MSQVIIEIKIKWKWKRSTHEVDDDDDDDYLHPPGHMDDDDDDDDDDNEDVDDYLHPSRHIVPLCTIGDSTGKVVTWSTSERQKTLYDDGIHTYSQHVW